MGGEKGKGRSGKGRKTLMAKSKFEVFTVHPDVGARFPDNTGEGAKAQGGYNLWLGREPSAHSGRQSSWKARGWSSS